MLLLLSHNFFNADSDAFLQMGSDDIPLAPTTKTIPHIYRILREIFQRTGNLQKAKQLNRWENVMHTKIQPKQPYLVGCGPSFHISCLDLGMRFGFGICQELPTFADHSFVRVCCEVAWLGPWQVLGHNSLTSWGCHRLVISGVWPFHRARLCLSSRCSPSCNLASSSSEM